MAYLSYWIINLLLQLGNYFQTSYIFLIFSPFWEIFMTMCASSEESLQYLFELQKQPSYIQRF
jgi:hypothetical protein